jgi:hypothetical protein
MREGSALTTKAPHHHDSRLWCVVPPRSRRRRRNISTPLILITALLIALAVVRGAEVPFEVTPPAIVDSMMMLANINSKSVVVDLGSGDGRIVLAALRHGAGRGIGIDADHDLVSKASASAEAADVASGRATFLQGDFFDTSPRSVFRAAIRNATVLTLYWVPSVIERLADTVFQTARPGTVIISHDYPFIGYQPTAEWFSEGFREKTKISGVDVAYLYKYVVGSNKNEHQKNDSKTLINTKQGAVTKQCSNNICTFKISHDFTPLVPQHTVAYTQTFVFKSDPTLQWLVHVMVENGKLRAMWIPGLAVSGGSHANSADHLGRRHGPVHITYRVRRLLSGDASTGVEGSGTVVVRGANTQSNNKASKPRHSYDWSTTWDLVIQQYH